MLTKANARSTVHRPTYLDYVGVKRYDAAGAVIGEHRFLGLYTSSAYTASPIDVPVLRRKVSAVIARAGFVPASHDFKDLIAILEGYPRDDLFQIDPAELFDIAMGMLSLQERRLVRLFVHREQYGRFISCLVFVPRDRYTTPVRVRIANVLIDAFAASSHEWNTQLSSSVLARLHYVLRVDPTRSLEQSVDIADVEQRVAAAARAWIDDLRDALVQAYGEENGLDLLRTWGGAFPASYQEDVPAACAIADLAELTAFGPDHTPELRVRLDGSADQLDLGLYGLGAQPSLSDVMPRLTNMGVTVDDEHPYTITPAGLPDRWIKHFRLRGPADTPPAAYDRFEDAFLAVSAGDTEDDVFNQLVLLAGLSWREVALLRAFSRYLRQVGTPFSQTYIARTLAAHPTVARRLIELFAVRCDPLRTDPRDPEPLAGEITADLDAIASLDEDRILRSLLHLVLATSRTNWFQTGADGRPPPCVVLKLDPAQVPDLPLPRPMFEVFVYSPRVEGVHLRAGRVARGGIRWSDRREDFRTEVLGLMKAQKVKNAVIVPSGAKGGFVVKQPPADATELRAEVEACYRLFITGLLDVTDNLVTAADGSSVVVPPDQVVRHDADDPYLVVAADKGTATFSDVANEIACARGFWLGDAFASGGSAGYDHKAMGITARGAWESVRRHFRHLGIDPDRDDFTVVGIGDMSGDVFGNGMLCSHHIKLVAAFDHRHVFLDPDPDPEASWQERGRLFALPGSSWGDYDASLLSKGGGIYPRLAKSITITEEARARLEIDEHVRACTPAELIRAILRAPVDLLYNGGIGTYVKARSESNADAGDKATDALRVDGVELRCRSVVEGGNLGLTQEGRIEYALHGGLVNTDAIDNSAGVDTSDHEVNIKVLLDGAVRGGELSGADRNTLLHSMTDEVAALVLRDNYRQNRALDNGTAQAPEMEDVHSRFMRMLEQHNHLDRAVERLPDEETLTNRRNAGIGLTVPELAVLLAYAKITLEEELLACPLPDDPDLMTELARYFPTALRERYADRLASHPLRREIVATALGERPRQPGGHDVRVPSRRGDGGVGARHRARARNRARDRGPGSAMARHRGPRLHDRPRYADRDVPGVAQARGAGESLAPAAPGASAASGLHDRVLRVVVHKPRVDPSGVRTRQRTGAPRPVGGRLRGARRPGRARGAHRGTRPSARRVRHHRAGRPATRARRPGGRGVHRDRRPPPARLAPRPHRRAAASGPLGRTRPQRPARRRHLRTASGRGCRTGGRHFRPGARRRVQLVGRYASRRGRSDPRDPGRHRDPGRLRPRDPLGRPPGAPRPHLTPDPLRLKPTQCVGLRRNAVTWAFTRGRPRRPSPSPCRRPRTCSRGRSRRPGGGARTSS